MSKSDLKTKPNKLNVDEFLNEISDDKKQKDCFQVVELMSQVTKSKPIMWGPSIVGFGNYHYRYESGREGDWFLTGFSPRKQNLTLYIMSGFKEYGKLLSKLGKYKTGKSCLYIKSLEDIDIQTLKKLLVKSVEHVSKQNNC